MHLTEEVLAPIRARYGEPAILEWEGEITEREYGIATYNPRRTHDVTLFILNGTQLALIRKHPFPPDIWRPPGGGVKPGEDFVEAVVREAHEETGLDVTLERYLVEARARFLFSDVLEWRTHVFLATTEDEKLHVTTRTRSLRPAGARSTSSPGLCASGCSRPGGRSGATAWRCMTPPSRRSPSDRARTRPCRSRASALRRGA
jgi:ADP-ribose pyrophosphatase YjhB (NUDIX family)